MIYVVTSNKGKFVEIKGELSKVGFKAKQLNTTYPEIQTHSPKEVVDFALEWLKKTKKELIIDDSGLFINALEDFPGVYSAFVLRTIGCDGILKLLKNEEDRKARFECYIGYLDSNFETKVFKGVCRGKISTAAKGEGGFGYDPIFIPNGYERTFAEISIEEKNKISHRGKAIRKFIEFLANKD